MRVDLVFPPFWGDPSTPHIAVPSLTAFLKHKGHDVRQWDLNLEALNYFLSAETQQWAHDTIEEMLAGIVRQGAATGETHKYQERLVGALAQSAYTRQALEPTFAVFHSYDQFLNMTTLVEAKETLNLALEQVAAVYHPTRLELFRYFGFEMSYDYQSSRDILEALDNEDENPFIRFYRQADVIERYRGRGTELLGLSISNQVQLIPALTLAHLVRRELPTVKMCMGGNIVTRLREKLLLPDFFALIDYFVVYEGEIPLLLLLEALTLGHDPATVPNLLYLGPDGPQATAVQTGREIDAIPPPDFDDLPLDAYLQPGTSLPYNSSVGGCYWRRCKFCEITGGFTDTFKVRSIAKVVGDLRDLYARYDVDFIYFTDESQSPERLRGIADGIIASNMHICWMGMARADRHFDKATFDRLHQSGCRVLMFGIESAAPEILKDMCKGTTPQIYERVLQQCHESGIWTHCFFMFDFPTERLRHAEQTLRFIENNRAVIDSIGSSQFELGLLTPVFQTPEKFGVEVLPNSPDKDLMLFHEYVARRGKAREASDQVMEELGGIKASFYQDKYYPGSFSAGIGNSINFITLLLRQAELNGQGLNGFPQYLSTASNPRSAEKMPYPPDAAAGTLWLDPNLHSGLFPLPRPDAADGSLTVCVLSHPSLPGRLKVLPVFAHEVLDTIRNSPLKPSELMQRVLPAREDAKAIEDMVGDLLVAMHSQGMIHIAPESEKPQCE